VVVWTMGRIEEMVERKLRVGVDIDGVLRDWTSALLAMAKRHFPEKVLTDVVDTWRIKNIDLPYEELKHYFSDQYVEEVYRDALAYPNAVQDLKWLMETFPNVEFVCVSHQWGLTIPNTLLWLGKHGCTFSEIHFTYDKFLVDVDYLIDDSPNNYDSWVKNRGDDTTFILYHQLYNRHVNATNRIHRLRDVVGTISFTQTSKYRSENKIWRQQLKGKQHEGAKTEPLV